jgi:osmotically-inducible protein OsmY
MNKIALYVALLSALNVSAAALAENAPKADNTKQNEGAARKDAVTAEKQKNGKGQVAVLADIRKTIMAEKDLSMDAKNIKILYSKGLVTLRGPVDSDAEKSRVEELAKGCNGVTSVKNLVTVSPKAH